MIGARAGIVRVGVGDEGVVDIEVEIVVANAGRQLQIAGEREHVLCEYADAGRLLVFFEAQRALVAGDVVEAFARILLHLNIDAGDQLIGMAEQIVEARGLHAAAEEIAVVGDHAAVLEGQVLDEIAVGIEQIGFIRLPIGELILVDQPHRLLRRVLARVEGDVGVARGATVGAGLLEGHAARILGVGRVENPGDQPQGAGGAHAAFELAGELLLFHFAVFAVAVQVELGCGQGIAPVAAFLCRGGFDPAIAVAAERQFAAVHRPARGRCGGDVDHAAGGVAIERGEGPADHFQAFDRAEIDAVGLGLTVGQGFGNAVDAYANAAHAEGRARAETANRNAQVLGEVAAVVGVDAGRAIERGIQLRLGATLLDILCLGHVDRRRRGQHFGIQTHAFHFDRRQRLQAARLAGAIVVLGMGGQSERQS